MVVKNCTGTYLRIDQKDYLVCNREKLADIPEGKVVKAIYGKIVDCNADWIVCAMVYPNYGTIEVYSFK